MKKEISFDLVVTKKCNFNCTYCFEQGMFENKEISKDDYDKILDFWEREYGVKDNYKINFLVIGGEPSIAKNFSYFLQELKKRIQNNKIELGKITYITNGYSSNLILNQIQDINFWKKYFDIQISYDGKIIHDKNRIIKKNNKIINTSDSVLKTIDELYNLGFKVFLKSTLMLKDLYYIDEVLKEFKELFYKYHIFYAPTEDKYSAKFLKEKELNEIIFQFSKVAKFEYKFYQKNNIFLTRWFNDNLLKNKKETFCGAGISLFSINPNLDIFPCHLADYLRESKKDNIYIGNVNTVTSKDIDESILKFDKINKKYKENYSNKLNECSTCSAIYCVKCPIQKYDDTSDLTKIYDNIENNICKYYRGISQYIYLVYKKLDLLKEMK